ncbi:MAG TPA: NAD-dependent epimerase/dehydratase family protein [Myxococcota bacterium]
MSDTKTTTTTETTGAPSILLTGATGFLGHHLLAAFDKKGVKVSALIRSPEGASRLPGKPVVVRGSPLSPPAATKAGVAGVKTIIHTAAVVKHSRNVPKDLYPLNIDGTLNMVRLAAELGARMIFVSTSGTVGVFKHDDVVADEYAPYADDLASRWPYYGSKIKAEREARRLATKLGVELVIVRPPVMLGPGDHRFRSSTHVLGMMRGHVPLIPRGGMNFADIRDIAQALTRLVDVDQPHSIYHLPGTAMSLRSFFHMVGEVTGVEPPKHTLPPVVLENVAATANKFFAATRINKPSWIPDPVITEMSSCYWGLSSLWSKEELGYQTRDPRQTLVDTADWLKRNHPELSKNDRFRDT